MKKIPCKSVALIPTESGDKICELDVPFVPTPLNIVNEMLSITRIHKNDILYDLGCGDGRIVITAAKKYGIRCVGVDLDPRRIEECHQNACKASVKDKTTFICNNLFDVNLSDATIVSIYLLSNVNLRLRSKLFLELKAGSRIISHDFDMDKWIADKKFCINDHAIFLWTIPANLSGIWRWSVPFSSETISFSLQINQMFQKISVSVISPENLLAKTVHINGSRIEMKLKLLYDSHMVFFTFEGTINNNQISGNFKTPQISNGNWIAFRDESSTVPFE